MMEAFTHSVEKVDIYINFHPTLLLLVTLGATNEAGWVFLGVGGRLRTDLLTKKYFFTELDRKSVV